MSRQRRLSAARPKCGASAHPNFRRLRLEPLEDRRMLAGVTVGNNLDVVNGNTTTIANLIASPGADGISLREAVLAANATGGADAITFAASLSGQTISLSGVELVISEALTIDARPLPGNVTIDGQQLSRIFHFSAPAGDFTFGGLSLRNGKSTNGGGAVRSASSGNVSILESVISGNSTTGGATFDGGGGVWTYGNVTLSQTTVSLNSTTGVAAVGGGIYARGIVTLNQSTVSGNKALSGGGVYAIAGVALTQSTVSDNTAVGAGGIATFGNVSLAQSTVSGNQATGSGGGGINAAGNVTLVESTVSGNQTGTTGPGAGGIYTAGNVSITRSTITQNLSAGTVAAGGIYQSAGSGSSFIIDGSIVSQNSASSGAHDAVVAAGVTPLVNYSLIGVPPAGITGVGNITGVDSQLGPLQNNGGPTQTHALLAGSPAINAGQPSFNPTPFDQRGNPYARVTGGRIDIGAVESQTPAAVSLVVNTADDIYDGNFTTLSLREAVALANGRAGADAITFAPAMSGQTIFLSGTEIAIFEAVTIDARPLAANLAINANQFSRIFNIAASAGDFTFGGLNVTGGLTTDDSDSGGAIRSSSGGQLMLFESAVTGSETRGDFATGGGIFATGSVTLVQSVVSGNRTTGLDSYGGGINANGTVTLTDSRVSGNNASGTGGGIVGGNVMLTRSTVSDNASTRFHSGGIFGLNSVTLFQSTVSGNRVTDVGANGGGISANASVTVIQSTISGNSVVGAGAQGGGISCNNFVTVTDSTISGNSSSGADSDGGGISSQRAVTLTRSTVTNNHAEARGGGVFQPDIGIDPNINISISGSIVAGNTAASGGDVLKNPNATLTVNYSLLSAFVPGMTGVGNITGLDPVLGPLADNGGPTKTHALLVGSPAINAGDPALISGIDQRGAPFVRTAGGQADIGAYERQTVAGLNLVVDTTADESDGNYAGGDLSLREAVGLANGSIGANTITFAAGMSGQTITLGGTEIAISEAATIDARPLAANVTVDAKKLSRIFSITATTGDFTLGGLAITGGQTTATSFAGDGGGVRSSTTGTLTIAECNINGNDVAGFNSFGGGVSSSGALAITDSVVNGNRASGGGGGISSSGAVTLSQSTVTGNSVNGFASLGGGVYSFSSVSVLQSTISGNNGSLGGGVYARASVTVTRSTVSGNGALQGGGIDAFGGVTVIDSTVSGNNALSLGGGIFTNAGVNLVRSTITDNHTTGPDAPGGGVYQLDGATNHSFLINSSIVAGNTATAGGTTADLLVDPDVTPNVNYSLIGVAPPGMTGVGNGVGVNPMLGPLANNGGATQTHAVLAGSPAINAGDPSIVFNPAQFDQRGAPFVRVSGGRVDIGAFEVQPGPASADFDSDTDVDGRDFLAWQRGFGATGVSATRANGNADNDADVDSADFGVWKTQFGDPPGAVSAIGAATADAVFASDNAALAFGYGGALNDSLLATPARRRRR